MVAVVVAGDMTDMIPLLDNNGSGTFNKGRNNISDYRRQFVGGLVSKSGGNPYSWRSGIFCPSSFSAGGVALDGQVTQVGGGGGTQAVAIAAHRSIVNRSTSAIGPYLLSQESAVASLAAPAADATNPRIDLLCEMPYDQGAAGSDAQHGPKYIWVTGDPAASPTIPALPAAVSDALILARVTRATNDNTIATADITDVRKSSGLHGGVRALLPGDALSDAGSYQGELRVRVPSSSILAITPNRSLIDRWDVLDSAWHGMQTLELNTPTQSFSGVVAGGNVQTIASLVVPDLGFGYRIKASGAVGYTANVDNDLIAMTINVDSTDFETNIIASGMDKTGGGTGGSVTKYVQAVDVGGPLIPPGSSRTIRMLIKNYSNNGLTVGTFRYGMSLSIEPL